MLPIIASVVASHALAPAPSAAAAAAPAAASEARKFVNPYANAPAPSAAELEVIRSTVPVLAEHGLTLTTNFYKRMLAAHPELKNIFNLVHQATGMQPKALAEAVYAYAANIDDLTPLLPAVAHMAHKHTSLSVLPEHYPIVGTNLLASLKELLTSAAFPQATIDAIISAWATAYGQLANILITTEEELYVSAESQPGGWRGWKSFEVVRREAENEDGTIVSLYLRPRDGGIVPPHRPGQFTSIRVLVPANGDEPAYYQPRQYTLSAAADGAHLRVTIKREDPVASRAAASAAASPPHPLPAGVEASASGCPFLAARPAGVVSSFAHASLAVGSVVEVAPPFGDFVLLAPTSAPTAEPVVLIGAGVGLTPCATMLSACVAAGRPVTFLYVCRDGAAHPMRTWLRETLAAHPQLVRARVFYTRPRGDGVDVIGRDYDAVGRINLDEIDNAADLLNLSNSSTQYYTCGPSTFMRDIIASLEKRGVESQRINAERFGSGQ